MYAELDRMIALRVIEPNNRRIVFVWNRLCLDARNLNAVTVKDAYPLPHIEDLLSRLGDTYYISRQVKRKQLSQFRGDHFIILRSCHLGCVMLPYG